MGNEHKTRVSPSPPLACQTEMRRRLTALDLLGDSEIRDLDPSLVVDKDVGSLDVSMNDLSVVKVGETLQRLSDERPDERLLERAVVAEQRGDGPSWHVLEENVEVSSVNRGV